MHQLVLQLALHVGWFGWILCPLLLELDFGLKTGRSATFDGSLDWSMRRIIWDQTFHCLPKTWKVVVDDTSSLLSSTSLLLQQCVPESSPTRCIE